MRRTRKTIRAVFYAVRLPWEQPYTFARVPEDGFFQDLEAELVNPGCRCYPTVNKCMDLAVRNPSCHFLR